MTFSLLTAQVLLKARQHKYTHRKLVGRDPKTNRKRYRYYYAEHHGGGITSAEIEAGSAFKLTFKGRRGHFHVQSVEGDTVTVKHDGRPNSKPVEMTKAEFRALLKRQHETVENKKREKAQENRRRGRKKRKGSKRKTTPQTQAPEQTPQVQEPVDRKTVLKKVQKAVLPHVQTGEILNNIVGAIQSTDVEFKGNQISGHSAYTDVRINYEYPNESQALMHVRLDDAELVSRYKKEHGPLSSSEEDKLLREAEKAFTRALNEVLPNMGTGESKSGNFEMGGTGYSVFVNQETIGRYISLTPEQEYKVNELDSDQFLDSILETLRTSPQDIERAKSASLNIGLVAGRRKRVHDAHVENTAHSQRTAEWEKKKRELDLSYQKALEVANLLAVEDSNRGPSGKETLQRYSEETQDPEQGADNFETRPEPDPSPAREQITETAREVEPKRNISEEDFDTLKSGDRIKITYHSSFSGNVTKEFEIGRKSKSKRYAYEALRLYPIMEDGNPRKSGMKTILRKRKGTVSMARGDLAVSVKEFTPPTKVQKSLNLLDFYKALRC